MPKRTSKSRKLQDAKGPLGGFSKNSMIVAAEAARMPMVFMNARGAGKRIVFVNDAFLTLTGYARADVLGTSFTGLIKGGTDAASFQKIKAAFKNTPDTDAEIRFRRKDGSMFWASVLISPVRGRSGVDVYFASFVDVTGHKNEKAHSQLLIEELNHRVRNNLTSVLAIVRQTLRKASDPYSMGEAIESRVFALSRSHDLLTSRNWKAVGLVDLIDVTLESLGTVHNPTERVEIVGKDVLVPPNAIVTLGLALNELASNAVKHGAFSNRAGRIRISWNIVTMPDGDHLVLSWQETGGPPVTPPSQRGFGFHLIERGLAHELGARVTLDYPSAGVVCEVDIPAPQGARDG